MADETLKVPVHAHDVIDDDAHFIIDPVSRTISLARDELNPTLIQHDINSERITFEIPKEIDGHDMTECDVVEVHYRNIDKTNIDKYSSSKYEVTDLKEKDADPNTLAFTWLPDGLATMYVGPLNFAIRFACTVEVESTEKVPDESGNLVETTTTIRKPIYRWNTKPYAGVSVSDGLDVDLDILNNPEYQEAVDQWYETIMAYGRVTESEIEEYKREIDTTISTAYSTAVESASGTLENYRNTAKIEIDEHVVEAKKQITAETLRVEEILVDELGNDKNKVVSQWGVNKGINDATRTINNARVSAETELRAGIAAVDAKVMSALGDDNLKRYIKVHDTTELTDHEDFVPQIGVKYAVSGDAVDNCKLTMRIRAGVKYNVLWSIENHSTNYNRYRTINITGPLTIVSEEADNPDRALSDGMGYVGIEADRTWEGVRDGVILEENLDKVIQLPHIYDYDKYDYPPYTNNVVYIKFIDCNLTYVSREDNGGVTPLWGVYVNAVYEINDKRKTISAPICKYDEYYDYLFDYTHDQNNARKVHVPPEFDILPEYAIGASSEAYDYAVYRASTFLGEDSFSYIVEANNIVSITKTATTGIVDTYTVMFDDGKTTTFKVTNGRAIETVEKTDTVLNNDIYTITFNDGTTQTFTAPNVEANRAYLEDNVEDIHGILNKFGATTTERASVVTKHIDVPERSSKFAKLNSFGGMSRKVVVPTAQGSNLLPFPYAGNNFGTDGKGTSDHMGIGGVCDYITEDNPWTIPEDGDYIIYVEASNSTPYMRVVYWQSDDESTHEFTSTTTSSAFETVQFDGGRMTACVLTGCSVGDKILVFSYGDDAMESTEEWYCKPGIFLYPYEDNDEGDRRPWTIYANWQPRVARYKFEHTKLNAIKSVDSNDEVVHTYTIPSGISTPDGFEDVVGNEHFDSIDIPNQTSTRKVGVLRCTGAEDWKDYAGGTTTRPAGVVAYGLNITDKKPGINNFASTSGTYKAYAYDFGNDGNFCGHDTLSNVYFATNEYLTRSAWKAHLSSLYTQGTPLTLYYELAEPVVTDLPTRLDKLIPVEPNGHLIAVTNTGEEVPLDVEFTVVKESSGGKIYKHKVSVSFSNPEASDDWYGFLYFTTIFSSSAEPITTMKELSRHLQSETAVRGTVHRYDGIDQYMVFQCNMDFDGDELSTLTVDYFDIDAESIYNAPISSCSVRRHSHVFTVDDTVEEA